jgi:hypothetical protein
MLPPIAFRVIGAKFSMRKHKTGAFMKEATWTDLAGFIQTTISIEIPQGGVILYRGQSFAAPLLPKLVRKAPLCDVSAVERTMLCELRRQGALIGEVNQPTELELLAVAQHHGMATRLLDWSTNPLVALWFACSQYSTAENAHLYLYRVYPDNIANDRLHTDPFNWATTKVFRPSLNSTRLAAQSGWFTIHPCMGGQHGYMALDSDPIHFLSIYHFEVPSSQKKSILHSLDVMGINARSLFPGVDGLSQHMNWTFRESLPGLA